MPWKGKPFGWGQPRPYLDFLPEPQDASMNVLCQITEVLEKGEMDEGGQLKLTVNYIEPPSNQLAIQLQLLAYNSSAKLVLKAEAVPKPDPRKSAAKFRLWKYWFKQASPAVGRPPQQIIAQVARLACQPYDYEANWRQAGAVASNFEPSDIKNILAVMVHPPPIREGIPAWVWVPRVQLSAAQIVARIEMARHISVDTSALTEVVMGPMDWTIDAAVIALTQRARDETSSSPHVRAVLSALLERIPTEGHWGCAETTFRNWLLLPDVPDEERAEIEQAVASFNAAY